MMTLGFGLLLSVSAFASSNSITCQRMAHTGATQNACFEEINREATLLDLRLVAGATLSPGGEANTILTAQVMVGSNPCDAKNLNADLEASLDENGQTILIARVTGTKEVNRSCSREYAPVYQDVSFDLTDLNGDIGETVIKNAEAPGTLLTVKFL